VAYRLARASARGSARASIEVTTPGIIYQDLLIVGSRVPEENNSTPGDIRAYQAETGAFEWIFHTVPLPGEPGYETWDWTPGEVYGGANPWGGFSLDEERGWVFCATGSAAGDFIHGGTRKGMNLFANCVLALDAKPAGASGITDRPSRYFRLRQSSRAHSVCINIEGQRRRWRFN
jgi:glucose dehydrogenase